jgi:putative phosphoesterase
MKIAIVSDTHDNILNLEKFLAWLKKEKISFLIHCGDICAPSTLTKVILPNFSGKIYLVPGNVSDLYLLKEEVKKFKRVKFFEEFGEIKLKNKLIAFTHFPEKAKELIKTGHYDLVFYGHTHKPWLKKYYFGKKVSLLVNPGNLANMFYRASFALYDSKKDKLELKILDTL